jgi:predicted secreted Zn-dependent protease
MGHRANGVKAAFGVRDVLAAMPPMQDCEALATAANASAMTVVDDYQKTDVEYDLRTGHGAKQGLRLP